MRLSKITILFLVCIIVLSVFVANISNVITINYDTLGSDSQEFRRPFDPNLIIGASANHLMWFIQISDLHVSIFHDPGRISDFRDFCNNTIDAIRPTVVVASGDLADAKAIDNMGSNQFIKEWEYYNGILSETKIAEKTIWLDIRGNHDNFNVPNVHSDQSYYHRYSVQGKRHLRSYMYTVNKGGDKYSFIAVDACLEPGPRRPFNFIGSISSEQFELLQRFEKDSESSNATIWFGHYPTSCMMSPEPGIRNLMRHGAAYLCGHLHTLGGIVPNMYTMQRSGILELELGDWKDNRLYRVGAVDHGVMSFVDVTHGKWPVILVTNPKHALFNMPHKEPVDAIRISTHIRILVFSARPIETVRVRINSGDWKECQNVEGPLYVSEWDPSLYSYGLQHLEVYARDTEGHSSEIEQPFSIDGSRLHFKLLPRVALMSDATKVFHGAFAALVVISVFPLVVLRLFHILVRGKHLEGKDINDIICNSWIRKFWILSTINKLFFPLVFYPLYITVGPWFVGEVIEGHIGAIFAWGTMVDGKLLPGAFTYFYGCVQLFWFHIPFVFIISHCADYRFKIVNLENQSRSYISQAWNHLPCAVLLFFQAVFAYFFWLAYGTMALIVGPLRTWSVIMGLYLWYFVATLTPNDLAEARSVWGNKHYAHDRHDL